MSSVATLRELLEKKKRPFSPLPARSSLCPELDQLLPGNGFHPGAIIELTAHKQLSSALTFSLLLARRLITPHENLIIIDPASSLYAPALVHIGFTLEHVLYVTPRTRQDLLWTVDLALRSQAAPLVLAIEPKGDHSAFRRFQIAAEDAGTIGLFAFGPHRLPERCWGQARWMITPQPAQHRSLLSFELAVVRSTKGQTGAIGHINVDEQGQFHGHLSQPTHTPLSQPYPLPLASTLAHPATRAG